MRSIVAVVGCAVAIWGVRMVVASIDDNEGVRLSMASLLAAFSYEAETFVSADDFLANRRSDVKYCILLDVAMLGMSGLELQQQLRDEGDPTPIVFVSANDDAATRETARKAGALGFLSKPPNLDKLLELLELAEHGVKSAAPDLKPAARRHSAR